MPTKHGLFLGLNYPGTKSQLNGCINDVHDWKTDVVAHLGVPEENTILTEEPLKEQMVEGIRKTLERAKSMDTVLLDYSGHGTIVPPGMQSWVPKDFDWGKPKTWMTYQEIDHLLITYEKPGVLVVVISDSCHSAADPRKKFREFGNSPVIRARFLPPPEEIKRRLVVQGGGNSILEADQDDILLAGCLRSQTSADTEVNGRPCGAFSHYIREALRQASWKMTYHQAILKARAKISGDGYDQIPDGRGDPGVLQTQFMGLIAAREIEEEACQA